MTPLTLSTNGALATTVAMLLAAGLASSARAGEAGSVDRDAELIARISEHDVELERRIVGLWRARATGAQVFSAGLGMMVVNQPASFDCTTTCEYSGPLIQLEPGLGGGQLSIGHGKAIGEKRENSFFLAHVFLAYAVKGSLLHIWSHESSEAPGETYVGVEGDVTAVMVNFSLGLFRRVSGGADDDRWLVTAGLGWGY